MTNQEFAILYLKAIELKNKDFFDEAQLNIMDCVELKGKDLVSVHVVNHHLPEEIKFQIESMFWKD